MIIVESVLAQTNVAATPDTPDDFRDADTVSKLLARKIFCNVVVFTIA